jgi:diguanylate cyclase (GGDEF)-like protein
MYFKNLKITHKIILPFLVLLLAFGIQSMVIYSSNQVVFNADRLSSHSAEVRRNEYLIMSSLLNVETGLRGFLIASNDDSLGSFKEARASFYVALEATKRLTVDNRRQQRRLSDLNTFADEWFSSVADALILHRLPEENRKFQIQLSLKEKTLMDKMRATIEMIDQEEDWLQLERQKNVRIALKLANLAIWSGAIVLLLIMFFATIILTQNIATPIRAMTAAMRRLVQKDWNTEIPHLEQHDEIGEMALALEVFRDVGIAAEQLAIDAGTDALTGIANRRKLDQAMYTEWRRSLRDKKPLSVLMIDIDQFKKFNDTYGHQRGDSTLKAISNAISQIVKRPGDLVARYGGEEITVLLPDTDRESAYTVAEQIREEIQRLAIPHIRNLPLQLVTVSIGVATSSLQMRGTKYQDANHLISSADKALYDAKRSGRNQVMVSSGLKETTLF